MVGSIVAAPSVASTALATRFAAERAPCGSFVASSATLSLKKGPLICVCALLFQVSLWQSAFADNGAPADNEKLYQTRQPTSRPVFSILPEKTSSFSAGVEEVPTTPPFAAPPYYPSAAFSSATSAAFDNMIGGGSQTPVGTSAPVNGSPAAQFSASPAFSVPSYMSPQYSAAPGTVTPVYRAPTAGSPARPGFSTDFVNAGSPGSEANRIRPGEPVKLERMVEPPSTGTPSVVPAVRNTQTVSSKAQQPIFYVYEFSASWCPSCKDLEPYVQKVATKYQSTVQLISVDIDSRSSRQLVRTAGLRAIPTLVISDRQGQQIRRLVGLQQGMKLDGILSDYLQKASR